MNRIEPEDMKRMEDIEAIATLNEFFIRACANSPNEGQPDHRIERVQGIIANVLTNAESFLGSQAENVNVAMRVTRQLLSGAIKFLEETAPDLKQLPQLKEQAAKFNLG